MPIRVHITWVVTFLLLSYAIGVGFIAQADSSLSTIAAILDGALASFLLFACLLFHEYGHVVCARQFGIEASSVDLFLLGGEAKLTCDAREWREELSIALAGPAVSLVLAGAFAAIFYALEPGATASIIAFYVAFANAVLAVANLAPAYPLDGGRALHAALWGLLREKRRSVRIAATIGEGLGLAAAGYGALVVVTSGMSGLWPILFGWYIFDAASRARADERAIPGVGNAEPLPNCPAG